jgi:hypothetical protein
VSVAFARALAEFCTFHGVPVTWEPGWDTRGNGQTSRYKGLLVHHTAGQSLDKRTNDLVAGRASPPLAGPLCNSAGLHSGGLHIIAAHPANHAGASGGRDTAPLPVTGLFNREVWGHEVMYPGTRPMSPAQWRTCTILGAGVCRLTGQDYDPAWIKLHNGTSVTGKWDAGFAPGSTYPIADLRRDTLVVMRGQHTPVAAAAAPRKPYREDDDTMYVRCDKLAVRGILSGGVLTGLGSPGEHKAMDEQVARGALVQYVEDYTWRELDRKSRLLTGDALPAPAAPAK